MSNPNGHYIHGLCGTDLYNIWQTMKQRCQNPNCRGYRWYGAKGIAVCAEWQDVVAFCEWANSNGYKHGLTIDRIDPNRNYEPSNCRWVTMSEQQKNRTNARLITHNGETHSLTEWSKILGISRTTLSNRIVIHGLPIEQAFSPRDMRCSV